MALIFINIMKNKEVFQYVLGSLVVIGFFGLLIALIYVAIPQENKDILNIVIGALIGAFTSIVGYFYGSSLGSKEKTEMMKK